MSISEQILPLLPKVRIPGLGDNVYKDECVLTFDTPESPDGLFVCLTTFLSFGRKAVETYHAITGNRLFLRIRKIRKESEKTTAEQSSESPEIKPKRLALGIEGGFNPEKDSVEYEEITSLFILPECTEITFDDIEDIHSIVLASVSGVLASSPASQKEELMAWDGEVRPVTKHAETLKQLDNAVKVPPSGWKCCKCDLTNNLWLNLTDGSILCGRRYYDGTGGNNHAIEHFKETGFPLCVKLGTITPSGADVHSYDEDTMVEDPNLAKHLTHFGINMMNMEKTEQTMAEMEIDLNQKLGSEWNLIQEAGKKLKELYGPGLIGILNMGNTCYMNSVLQVLLSIPEFQKYYAHPENCQTTFNSKLASLEWKAEKPNSGLQQICQSTKQLSQEIQKRVKEIISDFSFQMCKVGLALYSPVKDTGSEIEEEISRPRVWPARLKRIIGKNHPEFATNRQQDAHEYFLHLMSIIDRNEHKNGVSPSGCFKFMVEERIECQQSKQVKYTKRSDYVMSLPIATDMATNKSEVKAYEERKEKNKQDRNVEVGDVVRAKIPFSVCLESFFGDEIVHDFWSSALKEKAIATKRTRFLTFPDYLVVQLKKFTVGEDWVPKKLDVSIDVPDTLDLNEYRGIGLQPHEVLLPDIEPTTAQAPEPQADVDEEAVLVLSQMGFPLDRCRAAVIITGNTGIEAAAAWLMENPVAEPTTLTPSVNPGPSEDSIAMIVSMGFTREQAAKALKETNNNLERAADWIFSHMDELNSADEEQMTANVSAADSGDRDRGDVGPAVRDGPGSYELFAFVSHMGTSTMCGHYVCHVRKDGRWVIFNDEKVAESEQLPKDLGYIYFYKRR